MQQSYRKYLCTAFHHAMTQMAAGMRVSHLICTCMTKVPHPVVGITAYQNSPFGEQVMFSKSIIDLAQIPQLHAQTRSPLRNALCTTCKLYEMNDRSP